MRSILKFTAIAVAMLVAHPITKAVAFDASYIGQALGGTAGALLGSQIGRGTGQNYGIAAGTLIGSLAGRYIATEMTRDDEAALRRAQAQTLNAPLGQQITWSNVASGNHGAVTTTREGRHQRTGDYCREYQTTVTVGGKTQEAYGTACRQPDGQWKVVN